MPSLSHKLFGVPTYRWLLLAGVGVGLLGLSVAIRGRLDIEWSVESLRTFVDDLSVWGSLAYMGILTFRFLFVIPTSILLLAAGILFGPVAGTIYAGIGLFGSGMMKYVFATIVGRDAIVTRLPPHLQVWVTTMASRKISAWALSGICAYPFIPKHVFQFGAVLSGMSLAAFVPAVLAGSFARAAVFANVGEAIYSGAGLVVATTLILALLVIPMGVPSWRRWMLSPLHTDSSTHPSQEKPTCLPSTVVPQRMHGK